jgi:hypothetical protein
MYKRNLLLTLAGSALAALSLFASTAHAHITMKGALLSRGGDQKAFPCDGKRGDGPVYTFAPGTTITLALDELVPHPSYFRIAFDDDGDNAFVEPKSIKPIESSRACPFDANDKCGESDYCNLVSTTGATVLWDNLNPHTAAQAKSVSWNVKLPDIECENCTLQVLQIMEDTLHGAYCPTGSCQDTSLEDIYHRCIDIKLVKGATNGAGATTDAVNNMGVECNAATPTPTAGAGGSATAGSGGAAGAAGSAAGSSGVTAAAGVGGVKAGSSGSVGGAGGTAGMAALTAGTGAVAGTRAAGPAGSTGSTPSPVAGSPSVTAGAAAPPAATPSSPAAASDSGCVVAAGSSDLASFASFSLMVGAVGLMRRKRRRAA